MLVALQSLIALQQLDTAAEAVRKRLVEIPAAEQDLAAALATASAAVEAAKGQLAVNQTSRRELEKQVAAVDVRLAKFDDHRAAVKTNHEYTALLSEIATAKAEKDALEEQILMTMEAADGISAEIKAAEAGFADAKRQVDAARQALGAERGALEAEASRLLSERTQASTGVDASILAKYEQLLKQRRMVAVAEMVDELCTACHVRLRPAVAQAVRRNSEFVQCDSCQRILFFKVSSPTAASSERV